MKKLLALLLAFVMIFTLGACAADKAENTVGFSDIAKPSDEAEPTDVTAMKLGVSWNFMINESATTHTHLYGRAESQACQYLLV